MCVVSLRFYSKSLKMQIQMQLETIKFLQESHSRTGDEAGDDPEGSPANFLDPEAQRALLEPGESMLLNGVVPDPANFRRSMSSSTEGPPLEPARIVPGVIPHNTFLRLNKSKNSYVCGKDKKFVIERAEFAPSLNHNVISDNLATKLGGAFEFFELPRVFIDTGYGLNQCLEVVDITIIYKDTRGILMVYTTGSGPLRCLISKKTDRFPFSGDLILGKDCESWFNGVW
jgi:hypothetical protein